MSNDTQPEIRFPGFTEDWEQRKLGEVVESVGTGRSTFTNGIVQTSETPYAVLGSTSVISYDSMFDHSGDFILTARVGANAGNLYKYFGEVKISDNTVYIQANNLDFIYYLLTKYDLKRLSFGTGQPLVKASEVKNLKLNFPQKNEEQQKIGSFFKQLDDTIALHQRKLDLLKETKKGFLQKMFPKNGAKVPEIRFPGFTGDWEQRKLNDFISGDISDGDWIEKEHIKDEGKYRIIQTGNIGNGVYIDKEKSAKYMDQNSFDILKANEIFPGDLLVSRLAEPAGRTVILPNIEDRMVTAVDVTILRQNENFDAYFLLSQMNTSKILNKVSKNVSGTSHKRISRKNLEKVTIDSTSIEEQNKIGAFFKQLDDTIALHQCKLDLLKETKKGFLQKMFV
ncbi:restriction endonuclease subunit S [Enterococcus durans]|uniref:Restriction endonuclease subunit S n=2 Tax=Enterococcus durans TaxID=53345 RepID=A0AB36SCJ5_9ENTE|nr:restriction endonuclease subunit S [Enterococcus durans]PEH46493.1 restriction endonuclease subunit S [Enterococcus durans]